MKAIQAYKFSDLIDAENLHSIMATFYRLTGIGSSIIDLDGNIIVGDYATGWKRICMEFHRKHPKALKRCIESDTSLCNGLLSGEKYALYNCLNGMVDSAVPITIQNEHVANLFSGQYFVSPPDISFFREQARVYGFEEEEYLSALREVAVLPAERVKEGAQFLTHLAEMIGQMALSKRKFSEINEQLENRVQERTRELVQANQLLQSEISERKRTEQAQREHEAQLKEAQRIAHIGSWTLDPQSGRITYSDEMYRIYGFDPEKSVPSYLDHQKYIHPDDWPKLDNLIKETLEKGDKYELELRVKRVDGEPRTIYSRAQVSRGADGKAVSLVGTSQDITEQKQAAQYARSLIEASPDPLVTISPDGKITDVNEATMKVTGIPRDQLIGTDFSDYFIEPDKARAGYQEVFTNGFVRDYPLSIRHKDGSIRDVSYNATVYRNDKGEVAGLFAAARDVTAIKQAEKKIKERMKELQAFYHLSAMTGRKDFALEGLYQDLANVLPESWQYPEIACARIIVGEREFHTANFAVSVWMQAAPIKVLGTAIGRIEVGYLEHRPDSDEGPFLKDERQLINAIAERVGHITELKRAEEALRSASLYARSLIEASLDPLVTISAEGKITDVNEATVKVTGVPRNQLIGTDFSNYFTEPGKAKEGYQQVFAKGSVTDYPLTIRHKDGRLTDVLYNASVYRDVQGRVLGVFAAARDVTEQKQASQYARSLIEVSLDPLVTISSEGKITDVNEATVKVTGVPRDQLIGTDFSNYFTEPGKAQEGYKQVFAEGSVTDYPLTIRHRDGRLTDVLYNASVYRDVEGRVLGVFAAARDVTEQKQAAQYARSLIEVSLDPLVTISAEGKVTDVNEATIKVTGIPRDKLIGTDFSNYFTEPGKAQEGYQQVFAKGSVTDYPLTIRHKEGRLTDVLYNAAVYRDMQGKVLGVFAAARDVTESKRVMREFAETKNFLDNILQSSTKYSIIGKDLDHKILSWNEGARRNYGYVADEIIGKDSDILHTREDIESGVVDKMLEMAYEKGLAEGEFVRIRKDGSRFMASVVVTRRNDAAGRPIGFLLMSTDISEKKRVEEEVRQALREKETLLREIHHRVKNNLQVVSSLLDLQAQKIEDPSLREMFQESERRVKSMAIVHEKMYQTKGLSAIDFRDYIAAIVGELSSFYNTIGRRITTTVDVEPLSLNLDLAIPCALIINELLTNAYKHAFPRREGGDVRIGFHEADGRCTVSISDNGVGLPESFDWLKTPSLGFQLVAVLVKQLKGGVDVDSKGGVRVTITFKRKEAFNGKA